MSVASFTQLKIYCRRFGEIDVWCGVYMEKKVLEFRAGHMIFSNFIH